MRCFVSRDEACCIEAYLHQGYNYRTITQFLQVYHGIEMTMRTLRRRVLQYGLQRGPVNWQNVYNAILTEITGPGELCLHPSVWIAGGGGLPQLMSLTPSCAILLCITHSSHLQIIVLPASYGFAIFAGLIHYKSQYIRVLSNSQFTVLTMQRFISSRQSSLGQFRLWELWHISEGNSTSILQCERKCCVLIFHCKIVFDSLNLLSAFVQIWCRHLCHADSIFCIMLHW